MATISLKKLAEMMRDLDICMMTTVDGRGTIHSRPMSNNREVAYDGNSYFFSYEDTGKIWQIRQSPLTSLTFQGKDGLYIQLYGNSSLTQQKDRMEAHWSEDLNQWFPDGIDTKGLIMIHVKATRINYWQREKEGEIKLA